MTTIDTTQPTDVPLADPVGAEAGGATVAGVAVVVIVGEEVTPADGD
jgi:hypothetical protein